MVVWYDYKSSRGLNFDIWIFNSQNSDFRMNLQ